MNTIMRIGLGIIACLMTLSVMAAPPRKGNPLMNDGMMNDGMMNDGMMSEKVLIDGKVMIIRGDKAYNILGMMK